MTKQQTAKAAKKFSNWALWTARQAVANVAKETYFDGVPLRALLDAVQSSGVELDPEDTNCILCGRDGRAFFPALNVKSGLLITWHKMEVTGRYEVIAYMS
jgi:hypothetical protein